MLQIQDFQTKISKFLTDIKIPQFLYQLQQF